MKKFLALLISLSMLLVCVPGVSLVASAATIDDATFKTLTAASYLGSGTEDDPYIVDTADKFRAIFDKNATLSFANGTYFKQGDAITLKYDAETNTGYIPKRSSYSYNYDGDNFVLTYDIGDATNVADLVNFNTNGDMGTFGNGGGLIHNVILAGDWYITSSSKAFAVGGFAGKLSSSSIKDSESRLNIVLTSSAKDIKLGGFVGNISASKYVQRIELSGLKFTGSISSTKQYAAGIVYGLGYDSNLTEKYEYCEIAISDCVNEGSIAASSPVGGIAGHIPDAITRVYIDSCANYGNITTAGSVGGIIGPAISAGGATVTITKCLNAGNINLTSNDTKTAAGIMGVIGYDAKITTATTTTKELNVTIQDCYNTGKVTYKGAEDFRPHYASCVVIAESTRNDAGVCKYTGTVTIDNFYDITTNHKAVLEDEKGKKLDSTPVDISELDIVVTDVYSLNCNRLDDKYGLPATGAFLKTVPDGWSNWEAPTAGYPYIQLTANKINTAKVSIVEDETVASVAGGSNFVGDEALSGVKDAAGNVTDIAAGTKYAIVAARYAAMVGDYEYGILVEDKYFKAVRNSNGIFAVLVYDIDAGEYTYKPYVKVGEQYYYGAVGTFEIAE